MHCFYRAVIDKWLSSICLNLAASNCVMRIASIIITGVITIALCIFLSIDPAPLGRLLSPQHGIWQNAEAADEDFSGEVIFDNLSGKTDVYFAERLVPHLFAEQEN